MMQLQNLATSDYYAPVKISSRFIPCRPCLPARAFLSKNTPPERVSYKGMTMMHGAGCLPVSPASAYEPAIIPELTADSPRRLGGFTMRFFIYKLFARQTTINWLNCEVFQFLEN
ncbi:hypothetical protein AB2I96_19545 [Escherichia coli]